MGERGLKDGGGVMGGLAEGGDGGGVYFEVVLNNSKGTSKHTEKKAVLFRVRKTQILVI